VYELISEPHVRLAPWPACLSTLLDMPRHTSTPAPDGLGPSRASAGSSTAWARSGLAREVESLRGMTRPDSGRNNALNVAAYKMGRRVGAGLLDEAEAYTALVDAAAGWHGHSPREIDATVRSGLTAGKARPHTGPTTRGQS
jgi:hypothetical protein